MLGMWPNVTAQRLGGAEFAGVGVRFDLINVGLQQIADQRSRSLVCRNVQFVARLPSKVG